MKNFLTIFLFFVITTSPHSIVYNQACGFLGVPPLGCSNKDAICICPDNGDECYWVYICK